MKIIKNIIIKNIAKFLIITTRNTIGLTGVVGTSITGFFSVLLWFLYYFEVIENPYMGIVVYLMLPGVFFCCLFLVAVGYYLGYKKIQTEEYKIRIFLIAALTLLNILIVVVGVGGGVSYMNTSSFCGEVCHSVMKPEYTVYQNSAHSKVKCVECHKGEGPSWFVKSKVSGLKQIAAIFLNSYSRPVESPVHHLRPARDTCEKCHWPAKFHGDTRKLITKYDTDESNTPNFTILYMKVGGQRVYDGEYEGIHWHVSKDYNIKYRALDKRRYKIGWVRVTKKDGSVTEYMSEEYTKIENKEELEEKEMDCIDCHNRPTHQFELPEKALADSLTLGLIDKTLPFIYREGLKILKEEYTSGQIEKNISTSLRSFYDKEYPNIVKQKAAAIEKASQELINIYKKNVFPEMSLKWGYHLSHIGHNNTPGCGRCHNAEMVTKEGKNISDVEADCDNCHDIAAEEEQNFCSIQKLLHPGSALDCEE
ncbi:MAG: NapC/NirT family cytochrome c [Spirochaetia bacterium]|nr:NapC/NirT family cytochrome c [Spirochaetia bacterium]